MFQPHRYQTSFLVNGYDGSPERNESGMKTRMMHFATGPTHEHARGVFIGTAYDRHAVEHNV
jgi:hypothetical protein